MCCTGPITARCNSGDRKSTHQRTRAPGLTSRAQRSVYGDSEDPDSLTIMSRTNTSAFGDTDDLKIEWGKRPADPTGRAKRSQGQWLSIGTRLPCP